MSSPTPVPEQAARAISPEPDSAFTSDPFDLGFSPSLEMALPVADANEADQAAKSPEPVMSTEAVESPAESPDVAEATKPLPFADKDVVDLTVDDDDDVQVISAPSQQTPVVIKKEPLENGLVVDAQPGNAQPGNAVHTSIEDMDDEDPAKWEQALQEYMTNMSKAGMAQGDRASMQPDDDLDMEEPMPIESEEEHAQAVAKFDQVKNAYKAKKDAGIASFTDDIEFNKAQNAENNRLVLRRNKSAYNERQYLEEDALFFPDTNVSKSPVHDTVGDSDAGAHPGGYAEALGGSDSELERIDTPMRRAPRSRGPMRGRKRSGATTNRAKVSKDKVTKPQGNGARGGSTRGRGGRGGGKPKKSNAGRDLFEMSSLLPYDIYNQARLNREQPAQPQFKSKTKAEALAQLIESIPEPQRDVHIRDKNKLHNATKQFNGSGAMKADGDGKWKLRGMKTSLHHYQVLGAAAMRQLEKSKDPPGGILGDDMGLGKTVMAIANIIDGRADVNAEVKATLIVTPSSLNAQWMSEIQRHAEVRFMQHVTIYRSASNPINEIHLGRHDVVITSYNEVVKSMPDNRPPPHLITARAKEEWWEKHFEANKGVLHKAKWHRIVLDEAQAIKNHESKTSEGVWRLRGKYRWALSGTPVQNGLAEFFAYFRFLRMKATGDYEMFKKNYCKKGSEKALQRLAVQLHKMCIRRTHKDEMFGRPILQLPEITHKTVELEFTVLERTIYRIVRERFIQKIKSAVTPGGGSRSNYSMIFALLLRMRQLTAHILLIQKTLKELLEAEDLERLWELTKPENIAQLSENDRELLAGLSTAIATRDQAKSPGSSQNGASPPLAPAPASRRGQHDHELSRQFRRCLQMMRDDGQWDEANKRSVCHFCNNPPSRPHITSCLHIYCFSCLNELAMLAVKNEEEEALCWECGLKFRKTEALATTAFDEAGDMERGTPPTSHSTLGGRRSEDEETLDWYQLSPILQSTKTRAAVKQMQAWFDENGGRKRNNGNKILVFSQFRGVLKVFGRICKENGWKYEFFHGSMSFDARNKAIKRFTEDPDSRVLLAAMKAGGVGLNLTAANRVILIDLWWNIAAETQAFCRVFRIGQERKVEVVRFAVKNTIDIDIIKMQERKKAEIESAMVKRSTVGGLSTAELLRLFGDDAGEAAEGVDDEAFIMPDDPYVREDSDVEGDGSMVID